MQTLRVSSKKSLPHLQHSSAPARPLIDARRKLGTFAEKRPYHFRTSLALSYLQPAFVQIDELEHRLDGSGREAELRQALV